MSQKFCLGWVGGEEGVGRGRRGWEGEEGVGGGGGGGGRGRREGSGGGDTDIMSVQGESASSSPGVALQVVRCGVRSGVS